MLVPGGRVACVVGDVCIARRNGGRHHVLPLSADIRKPAPAQERGSFIPTDDYAKWFAPIWTDVTGQQRRSHPAPYPVEISRRLIRMFSVVDDTVLDPFAGTGTTALAAVETGRHSVSVEVEGDYMDLMQHRLGQLPVTASVEVHREQPAGE